MDAELRPTESSADSEVPTGTDSNRWPRSVSPVFARTTCSTPSTPDSPENQFRHRAPGSIRPSPSKAGHPQLAFRVFVACRWNKVLCGRAVIEHHRRRYSRDCLSQEPKLPVPTRQQRPGTVGFQATCAHQFLSGPAGVEHYCPRSVRAPDPALRISGGRNKTGRDIQHAASFGPAGLHEAGSARVLADKPDRILEIHRQVTARYNGEPKNGAVRPDSRQSVAKSNIDHLSSDSHASNRFGQDPLESTSIANDAAAATTPKGSVRGEADEQCLGKRKIGDLLIVEPIEAV